MKVTIIKIGGNIIDNPTELEQFLTDFSKIEGHKVLVHGEENRLQKWLKVLDWYHK